MIHTDKDLPLYVVTSKASHTEKDLNVMYP